jgi:hypothetical protein
MTATVPDQTDGPPLLRRLRRPAAFPLYPHELSKPLIEQFDRPSLACLLAAGATPFDDTS